MKINSLLIFSIFIFINPFLFAEAKDMKPNVSLKKIQFPSEAFWIKNHWPDNNGLIQIEPVHWRSTLNIKDNNKKPVKINDYGMDTLFISGSGAPSLGNMMWLRKIIDKKHPVYLIDLRQETHLYLNGLPISLFYRRDEINWGKFPKEINQTEHDWVKHFLNSGTIQINKLGKPQSGFKVPIDPINLPVKEIYTEQKAAKHAGLSYFRIEVPDYHPPTPKQVDQFLTIIKKIPPNAWIHFHCAAGNGRTTMFMVMHDIVTNSKHVQLEDIINRQAALGGIDMFGVSPSIISQPWKKQYHLARTDYIKLFYTYIHSGVYLNQKFSSWIAKQPNSPYIHILKTEAYSH